MFLKYLEWLKERGLVKIIVDDEGNEIIMINTRGV
jgi:hypothetical protein